MTFFGLQKSSLTGASDLLHLNIPQSKSALPKSDVTDLDIKDTTKLLHNYHTFQKHATSALLDKIQQRISRHEPSSFPEEEDNIEPPDYFSRNDLTTAYRHETFLQALSQLSKGDVEKFFSQMGPGKRWGWSRDAITARRFWRENPGLRARYFPTATCSAEWYSSCACFEKVGSCPFRQTGLVDDTANDTP